MGGDPLQLNKEMEADLRGTLGDDLGGFESFDDLFGLSNGQDLFKFGGLEEGQHETGTASTAAATPGRTGVITNLLIDRDRGSTQGEWDEAVGERPPVVLDGFTSPGPQLYGKRARERQEEDQALETDEALRPVMKVRPSKC